MTSGGAGLAEAVFREARAAPWLAVSLGALALGFAAGNLLLPIFLDQSLEAALGDGLWPMVIGLAGLVSVGLGRGAIALLRGRMLRRWRARRVGVLDDALTAAALAAGPGAAAVASPGAAADAAASGDRIAAYLFGDLPVALAEAATWPLILWLLFAYRPEFGVTGLCFAAATAAFLWRFTRVEARRSGRRAAAEAGFAGRVEAGLALIDPIRLSALEPEALADWRAAYEARAAALAAALRRGEAAGATQMALAALAQAALWGLGGAALAAGEATIGDLFAGSALIFALGDPARRIFAAHAEAGRAGADILRRAALSAAPAAEAGAALPEPGPGLWSISDEAFAGFTPGPEVIDGPAEILPADLCANITLFAEIPEPEIARALSLAKLDAEFTCRRMDERLTPGAPGLSMGQRVRLAIARAALAGVETIAIDHALDHLDRPLAQALTAGLIEAGWTVLVTEAAADMLRPALSPAGAAR